MDSWPLAAAGFAAAAAALAAFGALADQIAVGAAEAGYSGPPADLLIFDLRNGYSAVRRPPQAAPHAAARRGPQACLG